MNDSWVLSYGDDDTQHNAADCHLKCCLLCRGCVAADSRGWEARRRADAVERAAELWERRNPNTASRSGCISCQHVPFARTPPPAPVWQVLSDHRASKPQGLARSTSLNAVFTCAAAACRGRRDSCDGAQLCLRHRRCGRRGPRLQLRRGWRRGLLERRDGWATS
jgi:hypothetical protein